MSQDNELAPAGQPELAVQKQEVRAHTRGAHAREVPRFTKTCLVCGAAFTGPARQRYDTKTCRQRAYLDRSPEAQVLQRAAVRRYQQRRRQRAKVQATGDAVA